MNIQGVGEYDIPAIAPAEYQEAELISFNYAKSCKSPTLVCTQTILELFRFITITENIGAVLIGRLTASEWCQQLDGVTRLALHGALMENQQTA